MKRYKYSTLHGQRFALSFLLFVRRLGASGLSRRSVRVLSNRTMDRNYGCIVVELTSCP
jgi:hypothetical protein